MATYLEDNWYRDGYARSSLSLKGTRFILLRLTVTPRVTHASGHTRVTYAQRPWYETNQFMLKFKRGQPNRAKPTNQSYIFTMAY